ncbi:CAAX protease self-immunity [Chelatococcus sambhunathii]|nr:MULTISPECIES: CPBP family glutamic-type intramembrane protease [Chelatococcus]CUA89145.1 CAAX protease self-immunity [Chelatococcus sambhunathii]
MQPSPHRRLVLVLSILGVVASFATLPVAFALHGGMAGLPPWPVLIAGMALQALVVFALAAHLGLRSAEHVGLPGAPLLAALASGRPAPLADARLDRAVMVGLGVGLLVVAVDGVLFRGVLPPSAAIFGEVALWKRLLAGLLYGGLAEEILLRLFLVSALVYLLACGWREGARAGTVPVVIAIAVAAIVFGLGHLPATAALAPLTPAIVLRALLLNGLVGVVCGFIYVRRGLEAAMIAHAAAHLPLQIAPMLFLP